MIGVDISDRSIKVADISNGALRTVCWSSLPPDLIQRGIITNPEQVAVSLKEAFSKCSPLPISSGAAVAASIPEAQSFVRVIDLPLMADHEVDEAVRWAIRQHIPFDLDRVYLDWQPLPAMSANDPRRSVLVGAVQREVVDPLLATLDAAELEVVALELEAQAVVRSLLPMNSQDIHGVLILDLGATSTNVAFFDGGAMRFTASVQVGGDDLTERLVKDLQLEPEVAAQKKATVGLQQTAGEEATVAVSLHEATIELLHQVERVVREMSTQLQEHDHAVRAVLLSGGAANLPGIREVVAEVFTNVPIEIGNPWTNILTDTKAAPLSLQDASHFVTALGLALRPPVI